MVTRLFEIEYKNSPNDYSFENSFDYSLSVSENFHVFEVIEGALLI